MTTECGADYEHDWHLFKTEKGKIKACDGVFREKKVSK